MAVNLNPTNLTDLRDTCRQYRGNLGAINVSNITDFSNLFNTTEFQAWTNNDFNGISRWNVSNATDMQYMFNGCRNFNQDISSWTVTSVTNMQCMFQNCTSFNRSLANWSPSACQNFSFMFYGCTRLNSSMRFPIMSGTYNSLDYTFESMFENCISFNQPIPYTAIRYKRYGTMNFRNFLKGCTSYNVQSIEFYFQFQGGQLIADSMFEGCTALTSISDFNMRLDVSYENNPISAVRMFYGCTSLVSSDMLLFSDCSYMYANCTSLTTTQYIIYSPNYTKPTKLAYMFYNCRNYNNDLNDLPVTSCTTIESMFEGCTSFNKPLDRWRMLNCSNYNRAFYGATSFNQNLNNWFIRNFDTYTDMFTNCPIITSNKPCPLNGVTLFKPRTTEELRIYCNDPGNDIGLIDTSLITDMSYLFEGSSRPESDMLMLTRWDYSNVTSIRGMFKGCTNYRFMVNGIKYLDYISFDNVEDASELFMNCSNNSYYFGDENKTNPQLPKLKNATSMYENNIMNYCNSWFLHTDNLEYMANMFRNTLFNGGVFGDTTYRMTNAWNLPNLINMDGAFSNCQNFGYGSDVKYFDASNVEVNDTIFANTSLRNPVWWVSTVIPKNQNTIIGKNTNIDINGWLDPAYVSTSFQLECDDPDVNINNISTNVFSVRCDVPKTVRLIIVYDRYGKLGFDYTFKNVNVDYSMDTKNGFAKTIDLSNINPLITVTSISFSNIQQGLTINNITGFEYSVVADSEGTFTADILVNNTYRGILTVNSTKLIRDFTINTKNSLVTRKDFNAECVGYDVTSMTVTSNSADLLVTKEADGIFTFKPLNEGTFTATIEVYGSQSIATVISSSGISDLSFTYKSTEEMRHDFRFDFGRDIDYNEFSITSSEPNFVITKDDIYTYTLLGLVSGQFTAEIRLNNEVKTLTYTSTKLISDDLRDIQTNTIYEYDFAALYPDSVIQTISFTSSSPDVLITKTGDKVFTLLVNNVGTYDCIININGDESTLVLNVSRLMNDLYYIVYNNFFKINFNTLYPNAILTGLTVTPEDNTSNIQVLEKSSGVFEFTFFSRGTYHVRTKIGKMESVITFKVFFVDSSKPEIYQYPNSFINELIKPELFDPNLYIYQYNQYGQIEWISKYFNYMNDKMKKYLDYIYLWFVLKTNQDLSDLDMSEIDDNNTYFYLNYLNRNYEGIYKAFGSASTTIFWDGTYKWNESGIKWDTSINVSNLSINKFKAILRYIQDIKNKTFNIIRFIEFCNEFINADLENETDRVTAFVDETSFDELTNIVLYTDKSTNDVSILDSIIRSSYRNLMPIDDVIIRQKTLP